MGARGELLHRRRIESLLNELSLQSADAASLDALLSEVRDLIAAFAENEARMAAELMRLRREALEKGIDYRLSRQFQRGRRNTERRMVTWLHDRSKHMNDPHAVTVLRSAARDYGIWCKREWFERLAMLELRLKLMSRKR